MCENGGLRRMPRWLFSGLAGTGLLLAMQASGLAQEVTLEGGCLVPATTTYGVPFKRFVDRVNETGKGVLQIRIVGGPEAVPVRRTGAGHQERRPGHRVRFHPAYYKSMMVEGDAQVLSNMSVAEQRKSGAYAC